ncbi:hypothetical protein J3459_014637 [Metarhizium acridum]|nr:hypothetical protein J3459_014637 [Metarhizium acridum]
MAPYDGADIDECLGAANSIVPGDFESFAASFLSIANTVYKRALSIAKSKFPVSARTAFFSAATYFRSADFYLHGNPADPRIMDYWAKQTEAFESGPRTALGRPAQDSPSRLRNSTFPLSGSRQTMR